MSGKVTDVIFDLDGTLIDSAQSILNCLAEVLKIHNIKPIAPLDRDLIGPPLALTLAKITGVIDSELIAKLINDFKKLYDLEGYKFTEVFSDTEMLLNKLHNEKINLHIATNKRSNPTLKIINYLNWSDFFQSIYTIDHNNLTFDSKAQMLAKQIEDLRLIKSLTLYVGDTPEDMNAAIKNDLPFIGVDWGYGDFFEISNSKSNIILVSSVEDLLCSIDNVN